MDFTVEPVKGEAHECRQWGYEVKRDSTVIFRCSTGGTGPCWNIDTEPDDPESVAAHICDLNEFIGALVALRDSPAHAANVMHWD